MAVNAQANRSENDVRWNLLNSLLTCPHRDLESVQKIHENIAETDPLFYRQLAAWYSNKDTGVVRDHVDAFIVNLSLTDQKKNPDLYEENRNVGLALLRELPPYRVDRVVEFINGTNKNVTTKTETTKVVGRKVVKMPTFKTEKKKFGLFRNIPRSTRTEVERYLRERENDPQWLDATIISARRHVKRLYQLLKIKPSDRANDILFKNNPPKDSKLKVLKEIAKTEDPSVQAKLIIEHNIRYNIACTIVKNMTPAVLLALITVMTDQELLNNLGSLEQRGVMNNDDLKKVVNDRLNKAKKSKNISALKGVTAVQDTNLSKETKDKLAEVSHAQLQSSKFVINRNVAIFVDKSSSMTEGIELGKQLAAAISSAINDNNHVYTYAFDSMPYEIKANGKDIGAWTKAFAGINATGCTSCGAPFAMLIAQKRLVEQIILVSDEGEYPDHSSFLKGYRKYANLMNFSPTVRIIRCGRNKSSRVFDQLVREGIDVEAMDFTGDYYSIPNLLKFLQRNNKMELLVEIMSYPLPKRKNS